MTKTNINNKPFIIYSGVKKITLSLLTKYKIKIGLDFLIIKFKNDRYREPSVGVE